MNPLRCFLLVVSLVALWLSSPVHAASPGCDAINNGVLDQTAELPITAGPFDFLIDEVLEVFITPSPPTPGSGYQMMLTGPGVGVRALGFTDGSDTAFLSAPIPLSGSYSLLLDVFSSGEATVAITASCRVAGEPTPTPIVNQPPVAEADGPYAVPEGGSVVLDGTSSSDPDGDPLSFAWDLDNNGSFETPGSSPTFSAAGRDGPDSQTVVLQVCDDSSACDTDTATVTIVNVGPTVDAGPDQTANEGSTLSFAGGFSDPGLDTHTIQWDFGDGATAIGTLTPTHSYADNGVYTVTLTVTDDDGGVGSDTLSVTVHNVAPMVNAGADTTIRPGDTFQLNAAFTDPSVLDTHTATIDWGDGTVEPGQVDQAAGTVTGSHRYRGRPQSYTVTVCVTDKDSAIGCDSLMVEVAPGPPG